MLNKLLVLVLAVYMAPALGEIQKDPRLRDEDISGTALHVVIAQRNDGFYSYKYQLTSSAENKGRVNSFLLDLTCGKSFEPVTLPVPFRPNFGGNLAPAGSVTPAVVLGAPSEVDTYGIAIHGYAMFGLALDPGETVAELEIVSPAEPGMRSYLLKPWMDNGPEWAYPEEPDPTIPWIPHFTVTGSIAGPGCPGVTPLPDSGRFAGTVRNETDDVNALLTYSGVDKDRWHVSADSNDFTFTIHYSDFIDAKTFKVEPGWARRFFKPEAGASETVHLPLKNAMNMFHVEASNESWNGVNKSDEDKRRVTDRDVFEIRKDVR